MIEHKLDRMIELLEAILNKISYPSLYPPYYPSYPYDPHQPHWTHTGTAVDTEEYTTR